MDLGIDVEVDELFEEEDTDNLTIKDLLEKIINNIAK